MVYDSVEIFKILDGSDEKIHYYIRVIYNKNQEDPKNTSIIRFYKYLYDDMYEKNSEITVVLFEYHLGPSVIHVKIINHVDNSSIEKFEKNDIYEYDKILNRLLSTNNSTGKFIYNKEYRMMVIIPEPDELIPEKNLKYKMPVCKVTPIEIKFIT